MKLFLTAFFLCIQFLNVYSQIRTEKTLTQNLEIDTIIKPDYFLVKITVSEYIQSTSKGRKQKEILINLDSVSRILKDNLVKLGFSQELNKSKIAESTNERDWKIYYNGKSLFQVTYDFEVKGKDSINYLFKELPRNNVTSLIITPKLYSTTIEKAKEALALKGLSNMEKFANLIADTMGQKIIKRTNIQFTFTPKLNYTTKTNVYGQLKDYVIDMSDLEYYLTVYYTYVFDDK